MKGENMKKTYKIVVADIDRTLRDMNTQFGDIKAGTGSYATWDLTSSLLGHFVEYDVRVNHVTSYGNPDLSLLDDVTIHELIHSVNVKFGDVQYRGWVCNDVEDGHAEPDHIYFFPDTFRVNVKP